MCDEKDRRFHNNVCHGMWGFLYHRFFPELVRST